MRGNVGFHSELQDRELTGETKGLKKLNDSVKGAVMHHHAVFGPLIERSTKVDQIRRTIDYLEQHRFLFSLPSSLGESISKVPSFFLPHSLLYFIFFNPPPSGNLMLLSENSSEGPSM